MTKETKFRSSAMTLGAPGYPERSDQAVTVVRELTPDEVDAEVGRMFRVRFADGIETDAFEEELRRCEDRS